MSFRMRRPAWVAGLILGLLLGLPLGAAAQDTLPTAPVRMYDEPLSADELAQKLFPPKLRSIVPVEEQPKPEVIGYAIQFGFDSAELLPAAKPYLDELGKMMNLERLSSASLVVEGHTDAIGSEDYNLDLSLRRAQAVAGYLAKAHRIDPNRLVTQGRGESRPLPDRAPTDGQNRRVQFGGLGAR